jgi:hypothetical protein
MKKSMTASSIRAIEAGVLRWLWDAAKTAFRKVRGQKTERLQRTSPSRRDRLTNQALETGETDDLVKDLFERKISHQEWVLGARQQIKWQFVSQYMLGRGGRAAMTQSDWGRVGAMLQTQYRFLQGFEQALINGELTEAQARNRLRMYIQAATQAHEKGLATAKGAPDLPQYPGDGNTVCLSKCGCHWELELGDDEWLATWTLGAKEHCPDCLENAAKWNPLRVPV